MVVGVDEWFFKTSGKCARAATCHRVGGVACEVADECHVVEYCTTFHTVAEVAILETAPVNLIPEGFNVNDNIQLRFEAGDFTGADVLHRYIFVAHVGGVVFATMCHDLPDDAGVYKLQMLPTDFGGSAQCIENKEVVGVALGAEQMLAFWYVEKFIVIDNCSDDVIVSKCLLKSLGLYVSQLVDKYSERLSLH